MRTIVTVMGFLCLACQPTLGSESRPNVVIILADDLGYGDVGCYGANDIRTPNLDRFANSARFFTRHYVQVPTCGASRCALVSVTRSGIGMRRTRSSIA